MNLLLITFLLALVASFTILMLSTRTATSSKSTRKRLISIEHSLRSSDADKDESELKIAGQTVYGLHLNAFLQRFRFAKKLQVLLIQADVKMSLGFALLTCVGASLGCAMLGFVFYHAFLVEAAALVVGAACPYLMIRFIRDRRLKAFNASLPDAIDLMARSLRAGHSMDSSIELIAEQMPDPLSSEFARIYQQQRLGLLFREVMLQMGVRIPSTDLQFLITAILVQKDTGGDLTEILDRSSHVIRERIQLEGEVRTLTAQGRLTGWILTLLPIVMLALLSIVTPGYSDLLFHDPVGQELLLVGAFLIVIGGLIIRRVVDVQV